MLRCSGCHEVKHATQFGRCHHPQFAKRAYRGWYCFRCSRHRHALQRQRTKLRHDHWIPETGTAVCPTHPTERLSFGTDASGGLLEWCPYCPPRRVAVRGVKLYDQQHETSLEIA